MGANYANTEVAWFQTIDLSDLANIPTSNGADQETKSWALFGQFTVPFSEDFELVGGVRYTDERRQWEGATFIGTFASLAAGMASGAPRLSQLPLPAAHPGAGGPLDFDNEAKETNFDFQAVLKYVPNPNALYYVGVSEAFRSGGFSSAVIFSQEALEPFAPENLRAYEGGVKLTVPDRGLRFNASAFFYDYEGFQATFVRAQEASARLQNAGDVESYGAELSIDWLPTEQLDINVGLSLLDTEIVATDVVLVPLDGSPESSIKGNEIPNAPSVSLNGRFGYNAPLGNGLLARLEASFNYTGSHYLEPNARVVLEEDGYFIANGRVVLTGNDGPWQVSVFVRNLFDEDYRTAARIWPSPWDSPRWSMACQGLGGCSTNIGFRAGGEWSGAPPHG